VKLYGNFILGSIKWLFSGGSVHSGAVQSGAGSFRRMFISAQLFNPAHWFKLAQFIPAHWFKPAQFIFGPSKTT
jgi:hypothetical protein